MKTLTRWTCLVLAYLFLGLAIVGVILPGIPTVPFLLLSAWFAAKGSERLHQWLYDHPRFGQLLIDWEQHGAVSKKSKWLALILMVFSWCLLFYLGAQTWLLATLVVTFSCVSVFLFTRPEPPRES